MEKLSKAIDNFWERLDNINLINEINSEEKMISKNFPNLIKS